MKIYLSRRWFRSLALPLWFILFLTPGGAFAQTAVQDSLTIQDAVKQALQVSPSIRQQMARVKAAEARIDQDRSTRYPVIQGDATYARISPVPEFATPGSGVVPLAPEDNWDVHIGIYHNLYEFGRRTTALELAESKAGEADHSTEVLRSDLAYRTVRVFNSILFLRRSIAVQDQEITALNQHLDITRKRAETGSSTQFDVLTTQVRVATAETQRTELANALSKQETVFRQLLDMPADQPIRLSGEFSTVGISLDRDSLVTVALTQRPELQLARVAESSARVKQKLVHLGNKPSLKLNLLYGFKNGYPDALNTLKSNIIAGAGLTIPIWDGNRVRYQEDEAKAGIEAETLRTRDLQLSITSETDQAISDVKTALEKVTISAVQVAQADTAVRLARARYSAGVATNLDVLDAETNLAAAQLLQERAEYDYEQSRYALQRATGTKIW